MVIPWIGIVLGLWLIQRAQTGGDGCGVSGA